MLYYLPAKCSRGFEKDIVENSIGRRNMNLIKEWNHAKNCVAFSIDAVICCFGCRLEVGMKINGDCPITKDGVTVGEIKVYFVRFGAPRDLLGSTASNRTMGL